MPQPAIYNPQGQPSMSSIPHMTAHQPTQFPYPPPQHHQQPQPPMPQYMEDRRSSVPPPSYQQGHPPNQSMQRPQASPQPQSQQLPPQPHPLPHMSPPQPQHQHPEPPQIQHHPPPQPPPQQEPQQPLPPMEPRPDAAPDRPNRFLDTTSAIKKLPARKQHSIFTPIDENRSILSQHLESFGAEPRNIKDEPGAGGNRSQSVDVGTVQRNNDHSSPPPPPQRSNTSNVPSNLGPGPRKSISGSIPETTFTPPSRSNSLRVGGGAPRPKLKVQIPDEASEAGSNTQDSATSPANHSETATQANRRSNAESHGTGPVLPPPSPSASALLSAGATGPPNPFARPLPQAQTNNNMNIDTPVSALPSRFLNNEFLPSPSTFYPEWNFRGNDSNTLPSPLNFATPVHGSGPSFLRDENPHKRKSPEINTAGPSSDGPEGVEAKRVRVDS